jgi:chromate reductase
MKILGIAGSLRRQSYNRSALRAAAKLAPASVTVEIFEIDGIPGFSEEDEKNTTRQRWWN